MIFKRLLIFTLNLCAFTLIFTREIEAKPAELTRYDVTNKAQEIMKAHVKYKKFTPLLAKRTLGNFIDQIDPTKTYFLYDEIKQWLEPSDAELDSIVQDFEFSKFPVFEQIFSKMQDAIKRRDMLEDKLSKEILPKNVSQKDFKDLAWCKTEDELYERLKKLRALQLEVASKLDKEAKDIALQRITKRRLKTEEEFTTQDKTARDESLYTDILKSIASSLDTHTLYFTPAEASQFLIAVQQRLLGIGVSLKDDINGFTVVKIVEGGPADKSKELKVKDKIIAINGEPVIGLDVTDVVELIRGQEGTKVTLRVLRDEEVEGKHETITKDIVLTRGDVVLNETRIDSNMEPFGDNAIAHIRLHSFYQDADSSSADDIAKAFNEIKKKRKITGVVLDLRYNSGGILAQAVTVTGLFIKKGIVVSIKDENGVLHHLRNLESNVMWDGPLIVLINRGSASAAEIVAQTLQDYGRALIVGDDHTFGKGTFQTFTLTSSSNGAVDPKGEYKVTRGCYYTVSGKSPQLTGVVSDVVVPSGLQYMDVGERYSKYPLENDSVPPSFTDTLDDVPFFQREKIRNIYLFDLQTIETKWRKPLDKLVKNNNIRLQENKAYESFLKQIKSNQIEIDTIDSLDRYPDFQLIETFNIMKDFIIISPTEEQNSNILMPQKKAA
jgi:carboxyl-terminal processing protease